MLENSTQNKKEHRLVLVVAYAEFNKNLNENALTLFALEPVAVKKVMVDFLAPELSSLGRLALIHEYEKLSSSIIERIESCIKDPRWSQW